MLISISKNVPAAGSRVGEDTLLETENGKA
jgi:hypothetical protein